MSILTHLLTFVLGYLAGWCVVLLMSVNKGRCEKCPEPE